MLSSVCRAKKVLANAIRSRIGWFFASAHHEVNSNELEVLRLRPVCCPSFRCWLRVVLE